MKYFVVTDKITGKSPDLEKIALREEWAKDLMYCDMQGFALTDEGELILLDECGRYSFCPENRFLVEQYKKEKNNMIEEK